MSKTVYVTKGLDIWRARYVQRPSLSIESSGFTRKEAVDSLVSAMEDRKILPVGGEVYVRETV